MNIKTLSVCFVLIAALTACKIDTGSSGSSSGGGAIAGLQVFQTKPAAASDQARSTESFNPTSPGATPDAVAVAQGGPVGTVEGYACNGGGAGLWVPCVQAVAQGVQVMTQGALYPTIYTLKGGFTADIYALGGSLYFTSNDCTVAQGETVYTGGASISEATATAGLVFRSEVGNDVDSTTYYYLKKGTGLVTVDISSQRQGLSGACQASFQPGLLVFPVAVLDAGSGSQAAPLGDLVIQ